MEGEDIADIENEDILFTEPEVPTVTKIKPATNLKITPFPYKTQFERARIIGVRATQIANGAPPLVPIGKETDYIKIATMEFDQNQLVVNPVRPIPGGYYQRYQPEKKPVINPVKPIPIGYYQPEKKPTMELGQNLVTSNRKSTK